MARTVPTLKERAEFLKLVTEGKNRAEAARAVGSTGSAFRALCRRDEKFATAYDEAATHGRAGIVDDLRNVLLRRALDDEFTGRELHQAMILFDSEYRDAHQRMSHQHEHSGRVEVAFDVEAAVQEVRAQLAKVVPLKPANGRVDAGRVALNAVSSNGH